MVAFQSSKGAQMVEVGMPVHFSPVLERGGEHSHLILEDAGPSPISFKMEVACHPLSLM